MKLIEFYSSTCFWLIARPLLQMMAETASIVDGRHPNNTNRFITYYWTTRYVSDLIYINYYCVIYRVASRIGIFWSVSVSISRYDDTITKRNLGQYVCSRGTYVGMTPFRECPELQLGSRDKTRPTRAEKQLIKYELALWTRTLQERKPSWRAITEPSHSLGVHAVTQIGSFCTSTMRRLLGRGCIVMSIILLRNKKLFCLHLKTKRMLNRKSMLEWMRTKSCEEEGSVFWILYVFT